MAARRGLAVMSSAAAAAGGTATGAPLSSRRSVQAELDDALALRRQLAVLAEARLTSGMSPPAGPAVPGVNRGGGGAVG